MKNKLKEIRNSLQRALQWLLGNMLFIKVNIKTFFFLLWLFIKNMWFTFVYFKSKPLVFSGWLHYWIACRYADKRTKLSNKQKVLGGGKRHHVISWSKESLIVINRLEINSLKNRGILRKGINILYLIENAYYTTK